MQIFAVVGIRSEQRDDIVQAATRHYTEANVYPRSTVVFLASSGETTEEVSVKLGIGDDDKNYTGVVLMVNYYWGYYAKELWEWMAARSKANGT